MSIASAIQLKQEQVAEAYTAVSNKGGTLPSVQNLSNLASSINTIVSGSSAVLITRTFSSNGTYNASTYSADGFSTVTVDVSGSSLITKTITENGNYNAQADGADGYSEVIVSVPIPPYLRRDLTNEGTYEMPSTFFSFTLPRGVINLGDFVLMCAFYGSTGLEDVDFTGLENITGEKALQRAFANCVNLTDIRFPNLKSTFAGSNTDQFNEMLLGVTGCSVHFPSNLESVIDTWTDVVAGFGGTSTTVLFDLEATE